MSHKPSTSHKDTIKGFTTLLLIKVKYLLLGFIEALESSSFTQRQTSHSNKGGPHLLILDNRQILIHCRSLFESSFRIHLCVIHFFSSEINNCIKLT